mgnify:CR=1 FL=1
MVVRCLRDAGVASSNPVTPTKYREEKALSHPSGWLFAFCNQLLSARSLALCPSDYFQFDYAQAVNRSD